MKKLFIRFFDNKLNGVPTDSHVICGVDMDEETQKKLIQCYACEVIQWMIKYPVGKVDFVWL